MGPEKMSDIRLNAYWGQIVSTCMHCALCFLCDIQPTRPCTKKKPGIKKEQLSISL